MLTQAEAEAFASLWHATKAAGGVTGDIARKLGVGQSTIWKWRRSAQKQLGVPLEPIADRSAGGKRRGRKHRGLVNLGTGAATYNAQATNPATFPAAGVPNREQLHRSTDVSPQDKPVRHIVIPDTQIRKGVPTDHIDWIGRYIEEHGCDTVVMLGDWYDFPSLSTHDEPGSLSKEGARYADDLQAGNSALKKLTSYLGGVKRRVMLRGNHEDRLRRTLEADPKWVGSIDEHQLVAEGWEVIPFLRPCVIDGVAYSHYWASPGTGRAYGGSASNILLKTNHSFTQGHRQTFDYAVKNNPVTGREMIGLIAGACYVHSEGFLGPQGNCHFRGIVVKNEVRDGAYDIMRVSLDYLCRKYTGENLVTYLSKRYPQDDWQHLAR